jgi:hypothetical protein
MTSRGNWNGETGSLLKRIDISELSDQIDVVRDYLQELASSFTASRTADGATLEHPRHRGRNLGNNEGQSRRLSGYGVRSRLANWVLDPSWHRLNWLPARGLCDLSSKVA